MTTWIIRLRQISPGHKADSMLFRGTEAEAREKSPASATGMPEIYHRGIW